jgi:hypothetical protein
MANGFVHVASKLPNALRCRIFHKVTETEGTPTGRRDVEVWRQVIQSDGTPLEFVLAGYNPGRIKSTDNYIVKPRYATTRVPKDLFDTWVSQSKDSDLLKNRVIFVASTESDLEALVKEHENVRTGLEPIPIGPSGELDASDVRVRATGLNNMRVMTADEQAKY